MESNIRPPLVRWVWNAYFKTSLIPLLLVEVTLIAIYFLSNDFSKRENLSTVRVMAEQNLGQLAAGQSDAINRRLQSVSQATELLRQEAVRVMSENASPLRDDPSRFAYSRDGVYYTTRDTGGSAVFYSGAVPVRAEEREKAMKSAGLDPSLISVKKSFPLIVQTYFNSYDSLNRIYPYFDVLSQYQPGMDIPSFNFYYEADARHNPTRKAVWTDAYVDPAGQGWMTSCIAPVYRGNFLEGVVGSDITIGTVVNDVLKLDIPWQGYGVLISRGGNIMALPPKGEQDLGLRELTSHEYTRAIQVDTFKPVTFNLFSLEGNHKLAEAINNSPRGLIHANLGGERLVAWDTVAETSWKLLVVVPEQNVYAPANSLSEKLNVIAKLMIGGMLLFYMAFFVFLFSRARGMSRFLSEPLEKIDHMVADIADGRYRQSRLDLPVTELHRTAAGVTRLGAQLQIAKESRERTEAVLMERSRQLQMIFDLSPDGFVSLNPQGVVVQVNPAFLRMTDSASDAWLGLDEAGFWDALKQYATDKLPEVGGKEICVFEFFRPKRLILQCEQRDLTDDDSALLGRVIYLHDITKIHELDQMKSEFLATAAHELRTPLTTILGYSELLVNSRLADEDRLDAFQCIYRQSNWLVQMINELLDLARIEARAGLDFNITVQSLANILHEIISNMHTPEGRQPLQLHDVADFDVGVDAAKFRQALMNVIDNAYKYSPKEKEVFVGIVDRVIDSRRMVGVWVRDSGTGMTEDQVSHVFERFWRADTSGNQPGTGLGMAISNEIIRLLGGHIEVSSEPGKGTTVTIWLPVMSAGDPVAEND